ncbi:protein RALF 33 [Pyrenophora tritici-repentis]|nr:protein RALF 33 [Pyrenophora tritici-repentis]KAI2478261.1 protein RALF 33 [Pyrenophora tritici-repentis]
MKLSSTISFALCTFLATAAAVPAAVPQNTISNGALKAGGVPCSGSNAGNCRGSNQANPPTRGCSAISQCRD